MNSHKQAVNEISRDVKRFHEQRKPFRIYHGSTNSTRQAGYRRDEMINVSALTNILNVDRVKQVALVEPNVSMDRLIEATLPYRLIPPVVMEFPGITAGGGFSGTSGESSSFKYGFFDRTVNWIEIILPDGSIVTASNIDRPDLFHGAAAAYGTLGVITLLEVQLINAKTYVEITYYPVNSVAEAIRKLEETAADSSTDYLDGILFSRDNGIICRGRLTDSLQDDTRIQRFLRKGDPWFYLHAKKFIKEKQPKTEAIPLVDYIFRYDRGGFWVGRYAFKYFATPFNRITRWVLDYFMHTRVMYHALHQSGHSKRYIIQDVAIPYPAAEEFVDFLDKDFGIYPVWLCPLRQRGQSVESAYGLLASKADPNLPEMLLNFGIWGPGPTNLDQFVTQNRKLEHKVQELNGQKWLYAHAYYTESEFWDIYDRKEYDELRAKYNATHLPTIYDKVKVDLSGETKAINDSWIAWLLAIFWGIWPLSGLYGVIQAAIGGDYLLVRESMWERSSKLVAKK